MMFASSYAMVAPVCFMSARVRGLQAADFRIWMTAVNPLTRKLSNCCCVLSILCVSAVPYQGGGVKCGEGCQLVSALKYLGLCGGCRVLGESMCGGTGLGVGSGTCVPLFNASAASTPLPVLTGFTVSHSLAWSWEGALHH